jgi:hypothetical protein
VNHGECAAAGRRRGFWQAFAAGVAQLAVAEGRLKIKMRE